MASPTVTRRIARRQTSNLSFRDALAFFHKNWLQGEHVLGVGPTGAGKTTLFQRLVTRRDFVTVFATKKKDSSMERMIRAGYKRQEEWDGSYHDHIVLWPQGKTEEEVTFKQYHVFTDAIDKMYQQGGWTYFFDEVSYLTDFLSMDRRLRWLLQQSRSSHLSVVALTQRPAFIPLAFYDMPSWHVFWNDNDQTNLKRIQGIGGVDGKVIREEVMDLGHREVLIIHNRHPYERVRTTVRL